MQQMMTNAIIHANYGKCIIQCICLDLHAFVVLNMEFIKDNNRVISIFKVPRVIWFAIFTKWHSHPFNYFMPPKEYHG